jgi:hypothetical protein
MKAWERNAFAEIGKTTVRCQHCQKVIAQLERKKWEFKDTWTGKREDAPSVESPWESATQFRERFTVYANLCREPQFRDIPNLIDYCIVIKLRAPTRSKTIPPAAGYADPFFNGDSAEAPLVLYHEEDHGKPRLIGTGTRLQGRCLGCNKSHHFTIEEREELLAGWIRWQRENFPSHA